MDMLQSAVSGCFSRTLFSRTSNKLFLASFMAASALGLTACGGGSDGPSNNAPTGSAPAVTLEANASATATINATDPEGDALIYAIATSPTNGAVTGTGPTYTYTPTTDYSGTDEFRVTVTDTDGASIVIPVMVTVQDNIPDAFEFAAQTDVDVNAQVESNTVTFSGFEVPVAISVEGGEYEINGGDYTSAEGTVNNGDTVTVRLTSADDILKDAQATLTVANQSVVFETTTKDDDTPPTAEIIFPTPVAFTNGDSTVVRGTASDDFSAVILVVVKVGEMEYPATTDDGYVNWKAAVDLVEGDNNIEIIVEDSKSNRDLNADSSMLRYEDTSAIEFSFPEETPRSFGFAGIELDRENDRLLVTERSVPGGGVLASISLETSLREVVLNDEIAGDGLMLGRQGSIVTAENSETLYMAAGSGDDFGVYAINLEASERTLISGVTFPDASNPLNGLAALQVVGNTLYGIRFDSDSMSSLIAVDLTLGENLGQWELVSTFLPSGTDTSVRIGGMVASPDGSKLFLTQTVAREVISVNVSNGEKTIIEVPCDTEPCIGLDPSLRIRNGLAYDPVNNRLIAGAGENLLAISLEDDENLGERSILSSNDQPNGFNRFSFGIRTISLDESRQIAFLGEDAVRLLVVDLITGERVVMFATRQPPS